MSAGRTPGTPAFRGLTLEVSDCRSPDGPVRPSRLALGSSLTDQAMNALPTAGTSPMTTRRTRSAALDGLRGLALLGMMAWHGQIGWIKGGFARMTIFFVLAGFLAARSYLGIRDRSTRRPFRTFWTRRARRLLPITALGIAFAVAVTAAIGSNRAQQSLGGDALSVIANVSNWRFMIDDRSYGAMFENPSAFQHFWSLSVEEQWFLLIPLVLAVAATVGARREAWGRHVVAGAAVVLGLVPLVVDHTPDQAYYGTHVRGAELLAGVWLAMCLRHRDALGWRPQQRRLLAGAGAASLAVLLAVMVLLDRDQAWLYHGGMAMFAVPAGLVVAACVVGAPTLERVLGVAPLRWLGVAALSIYALHWPLFQLVEHAAWTLPFHVLVALQLAIAIAIGSAVHVLVERPLLPRAGAAPQPAALSNRLVVVPALAALAVIAAVVVVRPAPAPTYDFEAAQQQAIDDESASEAADATAASADATHLAVFGGSTALMLGLSEWTWTNPREDLRDTSGYARLGCGVLTDGVRLTVGASDPADADTDGSARPPTECVDWQSEWSKAVVDNDVDIALVLFGAWDTSDWKLDGDDQWRTVGDELIDEIVVARLREGIDVLVENGAERVLLATTPTIGPGESGRARAERAVPDDQDERTGRFNELLRTVAADHPAVSLIEYGDAIDALDPDESARLLPDGVHPTSDTSVEIWRRYLGPLVDQALVH